MMKKTLTILTALLFVACNFHNEIGSGGVPTLPDMPQAPVITWGEKDSWLITTEEHGIWIQPAIDGTYDTLIWTLDGEYIGSTPKIHITAEQGTHTIGIETQRHKGDATASCSVTRSLHIVEPSELPLHIYATQYEYTTIVGNTLRITPIIFEPCPPTEFRWSVDDVEVKKGLEEWLDFCPDNEGYYNIRLTAGDELMEFGVSAIAASEIQRHPRTEESSTSANRVIEYLPAPGQFINTGMGSRSPEQYALDKLNAGEIFSLGSFGGRLTVGFDHSIENDEGADFRIRGNSFDNSSEPGIVWVMQDVNGNGVADEIWYELRGSATGTTEAHQNMAITYLHNINRPLGEIQWRASDGSCGVVERNPYHTTNDYYPEWIPSSYTLVGTRLDSKVGNLDGKFVSLAYDWGYADNLSAEASDGWNLFDIANAIDHRGQAIVLEHIDFVRIQSGVCYSAPVIGDISTEVSAIEEVRR